MTKLKTIVICSLLLSLSFLFFSCENERSSAAAADTLAEDVVDELGDYLAAQNRGFSGVRAVSYTVAYIDDLKSKVLDDLEEAGLLDSTSLEEILPATVAAVSDYLEVTQTSDEDTLEVICHATESLVTSAGLNERTGNIDEGTDLGDVIGRVTSKSVEVITETVEDVEVLADSVGEIVKAAVKTASTAEVLEDTAADIDIEEVVVDIITMVIEECSGASETEELLDTVIVGVAEAVAETTAESAVDTTVEALDSELIETTFEATVDIFVELGLEDKINDVIQEVDEYVTENETALETLGNTIQEAVGNGLMEKVKGKYTFILPDPSDPYYNIFAQIVWFEFTGEGFNVLYVDETLIADVEYTEITENKITFVLRWTYHPYQELDYMNMRFSSYDGTNILMEADTGSATLETAKGKMDSFEVEYRYNGTRLVE